MYSAAISKKTPDKSLLKNLKNTPTAILCIHTTPTRDLDTNMRWNIHNET